MLRHLRPTIVSLILFTILTGLVYPLAVTAIAQALFSHRANGSLIVHNGKTVGSALIGQPFENSRYFWGRLSATAPFAYNGGASTGSNLGPTNKGLRKAVQARIEALGAADAGKSASIPIDLVTASGSGLDPHVSPAAALYQVRRVARTRGLDEDSIRRLVEQHTEDREFGVLGEPRVNVLRLNLALDALEERSVTK